MINIKNIEFNDLLQRVQEFSSKNYGELLELDDAEQTGQIKIYIRKFLKDEKLGVAGFSEDELVIKLFSEMAEFSFLTSYLQDNSIEEININSWRDVKITYSDGKILPCKEKFLSPEHENDVIRRLLHKSGMVIDQGNPKVVGFLNSNTRITAVTYPILDKNIGTAVSIRRVNPSNLQKDDFIKNGTATAEELDFLACVFRYGASVCVTGATGSGKTTIMSWFLQQQPLNKRIITIENGTREFDLKKYNEAGETTNNVVQMIASPEIDQESLLTLALTMDPDMICVGEMKSSEAFATQEAARTGHTVTTTIHANSCKETYDRMATLCMSKHATIGSEELRKLVTEAFQIVVFAKKMEDNSRKITEITEMEIDDDGKRILRTLFRYNVTGLEYNPETGSNIVIGNFEKVNDISSSLYKKLLDNGMPKDLLKEVV